MKEPQAKYLTDQNQWKDNKVLNDKKCWTEQSANSVIFILHMFCAICFVRKKVNIFNEC